MSTAFTAALPLLEELKEKLGKLDSATKEIEKAHQNSQQNQQAATDAVDASRHVVEAQRELVEQLGQQHQASLGEQANLLRAHLDDLVQRTGNEATRQLDSLRQAGTDVQEVINKVLERQPLLLAEIKEQHTRGLSEQQEVLQKASQAWATLLDQQMQTELKLLHQAIETLQKNTRSQHDELSAVTNQLQVATGRITAFAEAMNAAKFLTKLEGIESWQQEILGGITTGNKAAAGSFGKLEATAEAQNKLVESSLLTIRQEALSSSQQQQADLSKGLAQLQENQQKQQREIQTALDTMSVQNKNSGQQQLIVQALILAALVGLILMHFLQP
ncbi:hypothetical protein [Hymenobacter cellulosivorans]|uniref:Uncharacterized protein n=1 Tax=Hymenobacter cellulosivorans TaxID=2932249 RepID=A0ABY4F1W8_9BACT|nr:hypothetical protein [Hymenobacter cellulosivorans]UOQ50678.1 hypothetical protein MUN80_13000 [Hymenobacter cellulosivorans]